MLCIMNDIKVISFDLWGTLFYDSDYIRELEEKRIKACIEISKKYNLLQTDNWREIILNERRDFQKIERKGKCQDHKVRIKSILLKVNRNVNEDVVEELSSLFEEISLMYMPIVNQQLVTYIKELRKKLLPCIILSNTGLISAEVIRKLLKRTNLYNLFDRIYLSEEIGICKPSIDIFKIPIIEYSIFPHQMLHIGDSDFFDIEAAQKVGCRTIKWKDKKNI